MLENAAVHAAGDKARKGLDAMHAVIQKLESSDWRNTVFNLEQKWIEGKEKVSRTVLDAKHKMEEAVLGSKQSSDNFSLQSNISRTDQSRSEQSKSKSDDR